MWRGEWGEAGAMEIGQWLADGVEGREGRSCGQCFGPGIVEPV